MTRDEYRAEVDAVGFDPGFQERTVARLAELAREKEQEPMKKWNFRTGLVAAAIAAALMISAAAAVVWLSPREVALHSGQEALAAAFDSGEAVAVNETKTVDGYNVTLMGLVSGEGLSLTENGVAQDKTYAVLTFVRADGDAITGDIPELTVSPVVSGYAPWRVNAWTLNGSTHTFAQDGTLYYLLECDTIQPFADRTVSLAVYPGTHMPPDSGTFGFDEETGAITVKEGAKAVLFTLPLDPEKADPQKAEAILGGMFWAQAEPDAAPEDGVEDADGPAATQDGGDGQVITLSPGEKD